MTTTYAALLRGINVGGNRKVPMAELRKVLGELGHDAVKTYLNSGNAVFTAARDDPDALAADLEAALEKRFGFHVACMVRGGPYLRSVLDACPFPAAELEGKQLHATFFGGPTVTADRFASIDRAAFLPEEFRLGDQVLYLYAPQGVGRSPLAAALSRPGLLKGVDVTSRNWNTVKALVGMTEAGA
ncbi:DUF1697 domain-containing protein [Streptomyces sp. NPDC001691]|uniref:DUF1697 domain-containing protein n=1 Tax=unclassified Streptomyces TaxID=2593676 RepID=UPI000DEACB7E|nr:DUF1697 domain-containing protein [Streptomyces sp. SDr-06]RCH64046.1 DUF1697 domain-containing protein [Streptomyces sp. SDr-06]